MLLQQGDKILLLLGRGLPLTAEIDSDLPPITVYVLGEEQSSELSLASLHMYISSSSSGYMGSAHYQISNWMVRDLKLRNN